MTRKLFCALLLLALLASGAKAADVGEVLFVKGVAAAQRAGEAARFVGKGDSVAHTDAITTGEGSFAIVKLDDGSRVTVRPETVVSLEEFENTESGGSALLRLFRGGLRAITGLISQRDPDAYQVVTPTATIGIRGTRFDARLCEDDCAREAQQLQGQPRGEGSAVVGRIVLVRGSLQATDARGAVRRVVLGGPVYERELLQTSERGFAVIAFRDDTRVTLVANTRFRIEHYTHRAEEPEEDSVFFRLIRGGLRAVTGLIGSRRARAFNIGLPVATIGIRGTSFDLYCDGACADGGSQPEPSGDEASASAQTPAPSGAAACRATEDMFAHVWDGAIGVRTAGGLYEVRQGETLCASPSGTSPVLLPDVPAFIRDNDAPRPDTVAIDLAAVHGATERDEPVPGLYVVVRDGHVSLLGANNRLDLGRGETGYVSAAGDVFERLVNIPLFMSEDAAPAPEQFDEDSQRLLDLFGGELRRPGDPPLECRI